MPRDVTLTNVNEVIIKGKLKKIMEKFPHLAFFCLLCTAKLTSAKYLT